MFSSLALGSLVPLALAVVAGLLGADAAEVGLVVLSGWLPLIAVGFFRRRHRHQVRRSPPSNLPPAADDSERKYLRAMLDGMADGVWVTRHDGSVVAHNRAMKALLLTSRELTGQRPLELLRSAALHDAVVRACQQQEASELDVPLQGARVLTVSVIPLGNDERGSMAVFRDVTELRHLEKVRKDFVANVSHELRTPITAIRGYAETLAAGAIADAQNAPRMVEIIHRQAQRLGELVEDLLELSRLESKEPSFTLVPVDVAAAATAAIETVRPRAQAKNQVLEANVPPALWSLGDARALEQILVNLLDNAVKYTPSEGRIELLGLPFDERHLELRVKDTGPGIDTKHQIRIFERFYRVDKGRARDQGGTGLGLSIVKHLATSMNGEVRVESAVGSGSTFRVILPRSPLL